MVRVPTLAFLPTLTVMNDDPEPGAGIELGLKLTLTPPPAPEADKLIDELKLPEAAVVIVELPEVPLEMLNDVGDAPMVKSPGVPVTVRVTVVVSIVLPEVPVTVMVYVPATVDDATVIVMSEVPEPGAAIGLVPKVTVTPVGWPLAVKVTAALNPPVTVLVMVEVPALPCATDTEAGEAERLKPGVDELPASALSSPDPLGLPHPVTKS